MTLKLTNTRTGEKEAFVPEHNERVTMYVCGPTVYSYAHIGNVRPAVVYDVLYRFLKERYGNVVYARNITDVDDKINKAAKEQGVPISEITEKYTRIYHEDIAALNVQEPSIEPKVTDHMPEIITEIEALIENGHAYVAEGHVLFDVPSFSDYGALSGRNMDEMLAGARVEVAPYKKDPMDFVLWKPSNDDTPGWDSPWGRGRPGWHIECTSMIRKHLGTPIDIHGGGQDLIFPHHENELAQGVCASGGKPYCNYWVHNGFVKINGEKMAKSDGNILLVHDLLKQYPGEVIRFALLSSHYRQPLDWTEERLNQAKKALDGLYRVLLSLKDFPVKPHRITMPETISICLQDDLNTPKALAVLHQIARAINQSTEPETRHGLKEELLGAGKMLGLLEQDPEAWFQNHPQREVDEATVEAIMEERNAARATKQYQKADDLRDDLLALGVAVEDSAEGSIWRFL